MRRKHSRMMAIILSTIILAGCSNSSHLSVSQTHSSPSALLSRDRRPNRSQSQFHQSGAVISNYTTSRTIPIGLSMPK